jgi:chloramphenicol 3-O phosphotransferase
VEQRESAGRIILLDGPSSSGKSSLAAALQAVLPGAFWHYSIDHLVQAKVLPWGRIESGEFPWHSLRDAFFEGFHRSIPALAGAGNDLIVEHIVETGAWLERLLGLLRGFDVYFVGLRCPLSELERRAASRSEVKLEEAKSDINADRGFATYDLVVDSTKPPAQSAGAVFRAWETRIRPSAFDRMVKRGESTSSTSSSNLNQP